MGLFNLLKKETEMIMGVEFPMFNGRKTWSYHSNTNKYKRKTYYYKINREKMDEYLQKLSEFGFNKATDVRYDKDNAYVIVEEKDDSLHIAFHVKK